MVRPVQDDCARRRRDRTRVRREIESDENGCRCEPSHGDGIRHPEYPDSPGLQGGKDRRADRRRRAETASDGEDNAAPQLRGGFTLPDVTAFPCSAWERVFRPLRGRGRWRVQISAPTETVGASAT